MAIFRCKMCGGDLEVIEGTSSCTCEFCGTQQTIPTVKDEGLQTLFNRANVLRMKSEFDKAAEVYEKILQRSETEAEAYWGLILCKYGIEYVEDPKTFKRIPTCHRASYDAVVSDENYRNAIKYADAVQRSIYESEAAAIDEIQKGIIALAQKEDPYDVFICYKETDENGKRTQDSVIANDIYYQLTREGFKVFYAAITLEDKLGTEYEPYIFSALNTSKVMLSLGTKPEYFNAVWVKNEWSRFLKIMKKDRTKLLIPCYRDMDPYELPEEFAHLQAQDMSKIGFINDIVRGIKKVIVKEADKPKTQETVVVQQSTGSMTANAQIKRGNMALEDHDWDKADSFFEEALNLDPECAEAYIGKLLAKDKKPGFASWIAMQKDKYSSATTERLEACPADTAHVSKKVSEYVLEGYLNAATIQKQYEYDRGYDSALSCRRSQKAKQQSELAFERLLTRAKQYAKGATQKQIEDGLAEITAILDQRIAQAQEQDQQSIARMKAAYEAHLAQADKKAESLNEEAQNRREQRYQSAVSLMKSAGDVPAYEKARDALKAMNGYKDSNDLAAKCQKEIDRLNEEKRQEEERQAAIRKKEAERAAKKKKTITAIVAAVAVVCIAAFFVVTKVIIPNNNYNAAVALMDSGDYEAAINAFEAMDGYKDSAEQIEVCQNNLLDKKYNAAVALMESGDYEAAITAFEAMDGYKDSSDQIEQCYIGMYGEERYNLIKSISVGDSYTFGSYEQDNNTSNGKEDIEWIVLDKDGANILVISKYALDCQQYNTSYTDVTWESCSLRKWMNGTFLNAAFSSEEAAMIATTTVTADKNPSYSTNAGNDTQDQVFLLSITEVEKYFSSNNDRMCVPTAYAIAQGAYTSSSYSVGGAATCWWWLRSPGDRSNYAADVSSDGSVNYSGDYVSYGSGCVRPALWINLGS